MPMCYQLEKTLFLPEAFGVESRPESLEPAVFLFLSLVSSGLASYVTWHPNKSKLYYHSDPEDFHVLVTDVNTPFLIFAALFTCNSIANLRIFWRRLERVEGWGEGGYSLPHVSCERPVTQVCVSQACTTTILQPCHKTRLPASKRITDKALGGVLKALMLLSFGVVTTIYSF